MDSTVQDTPRATRKAVSYPTDGKLYERCRQHLFRLSRRYRIKLRQNYSRKALKQLKTLVGRVQRDIERQLLAQPEAVRLAFDESLAKTRRILGQQRQDKDRLYSFHAPEFECIANTLKGIKGKAHKKYEFGVKVGITVTNKSNSVLVARSFPGNPYDGHTPESYLEQAEILSGTRANEVFVDLGYRGVEVPNVTVYKARQKGGINTRRLKRALKRRNGIESVIGHLKNDGLLQRNNLKGEIGNAMCTPSCAVQTTTSA